MIDAEKILLVNCSSPNYNLAIDKMKVYFGNKAVEADSVFGLFVPDHDAVCLSVIFSWDVPNAVMQAKFSLSNGKKVLIGGGGTQQLHNWIKSETGIEPHYKVHPDLENVDAQFKMVYVAWLEGEEYKGIVVSADSVTDCIKEIGISLHVLELYRKNTKR